MRPARILSALVLAAALGGCATETRRNLDRTVDQEIPSETPESRRQVHVDLIRGMIDNGQYYAAVAHIQAQVRESGATPQLKLFEAEARRNLKQNAEAQALYRELLKNPNYAADAYYGLGLISAQTDLRTSTWQLQQAASRRPADADIRNDLGYALMLARRYPEALAELATAVELEAGSGSAKARNNLMLLMMVTGDEARVQRLVAESAMPPETLDGLRRKAQTLSRPAPAARATAPAPRKS